MWWTSYRRTPGPRSTLLQSLPFCRFLRSRRLFRRTLCLTLRLEPQTPTRRVRQGIPSAASRLDRSLPSERSIPSPHSRAGLAWCTLSRPCTTCLSPTLALHFRIPRLQCSSAPACMRVHDGQLRLGTMCRHCNRCRPSQKKGCLQRKRTPRRRRQTSAGTGLGLPCPAR